MGPEKWQQRKNCLYHTRNKICPNVKQAAELLGVEEAEILRMDLEGAPVYAERLLLMLLMWDSSQIRAPGWEDWKFIRSDLVHKNKRWRPESLLHHWNNTERLEQLGGMRLKAAIGMAEWPKRPGRDGERKSLAS